MLKDQYPHVCVIIPSYNHAHYLTDAIRSVFQQTYQDFEVIVVDDGSTDDTGEIAAQFGKQIRYIRQENQGLSAARNTGIRAAKGELVGLLDADDLYEPEFLATLIPILQSGTEIDGVYCSAQAVDIENNPLPQKIGKVVQPEQFSDSLLKGGFFPPLCMFAYKYCYEELGLFDGSFQGCADWDMWLRMSTRYHIVGTDSALVRYRIVPNSMSHDVAHMLDDRMRVLQKHFADEPEDPSHWSPAYRKALGYSYIRATIEFLQANNLDKANCYLGEAFGIYPEMASDFDVFYKLGLGSQPMGYRGNYSDLDLDKNARILMTMLDALRDDPKMVIKFQDYQKTVYANAFLALGSLNYGARRFDKARQYLIRAVSTKPDIALRSRHFRILIKSFLGLRLVDWLKVRTQQGSKQLMS